jgi:twinkle protein
MADHQTEAEFLFHAPCDDCGSSDAKGVYDDGHTFCFACETHTKGTGEEAPAAKKRAKNLLPMGDFRALLSRKITQETCQHLGYFVTRWKGQTVQVACYYNEHNEMVAQKLRTKDKDFVWIGEAKGRDVLPFGAHAWPHTGRKIVVTEGEIDALSMSQVQGNKWPVVSIPTGAGAGVRKYFARHREYFDGFEEVVLMFDMDEPGREAAEAAAEVLGKRAKVAMLPLKDPNEMLVEGRTDELVTAMWKAKDYRPENIVEIGELKDSVIREPQWGLSWPYPRLTEATFGIRLGELYALGAGTGAGKTDFFAETVAHMVQEHGVPVGVFSLEQEPRETATRLLGKFARRPFHVPDGSWTLEELEAAWEEHLKDHPDIFFYDSFGINEWERIRSKIEYLRDAHDVRYFFIDHLTAMAAWQDDERKALEKIMADLGGLVKQVPITIFFVSHLATPDGLPHEEGGRVKVRHFKGSRSIGFWSHYMFGMERNQQAEDEVERTITTFRILKDRYTGRSTGKVITMGYDFETGTLFERTRDDTFDPSEFEEAGSDF